MHINTFIQIRAEKDVLEIFKASIVEAKTNIPDFQKRKTINKPKLQCSQKCEIPAIYISIMELGYARPTDEP